jgi:hypothetical protein
MKYILLALLVFYGDPANLVTLIAIKDKLSLKIRPGDWSMAPEFCRHRLPGRHITGLARFHDHSSHQVFA